jgi:hypothetical protein
VEIVQHVTDDLLERHAMPSLVDAEAGSLEEHLLICPECRARLQAEICFATAMRAAALKVREQERIEDRSFRVG